MALYDVSDSAKKANPVLVGGGTLYADMPVASEVKFDGTEIPSAFLACDGSTFSATIYPELAEALGGTTLPTNSGYIIKAKSEAIPTSFLAKVDEAVEDVYGDIIPSDASASNQLVTADETHDLQLFINGATYATTTDFINKLASEINAIKPNTSRTYGGTISGEWTGKTYFIGTYTVNNTGAGIAQIKCENAQSGKDVCVFTLSGGSPAVVSWQKLVTESDISYLSRDKLMYHQETGTDVLYAAAVDWQLSINNTYLVHVTASDKNSPADNYDGIIRFTYGGAGAITNIGHYKLSGTGSIDATNNYGTLQFNFVNGLPEVCIAFLG